MSLKNKTLSAKSGKGSVNHAVDADVKDVPHTVLNGATPELKPVLESAPQESITGRGVFAVSILGAAVSIETAFLAEDVRALRLPSVFPSRAYAMEQIDDLRRIVNQYFDQIDAEVHQSRQ